MIKMIEYYDKFAFNQDELDFRLPELKANEYVIEPGLYYAAKLAMMLKQPLLLTGKPGTGKTRLAYKLAADLQSNHPDSYLPTPLVFHTKTTSAYADLFYTYDALDHFHEATFRKEKPDSSEFISLQPLGQAIMLANNTDHPYRVMKELEGSSMIQ